MHNSRLDGPRALVVVAGILVKKSGKDRVSQEVTAASVGELCSKTFAVSRGALSVSGVSVRPLLDASSYADAKHGNRIEGAPGSEREFLFRGKWRSVMNVAGVEVWEETDQTLLLFRFICSAAIISVGRTVTSMFAVAIDSETSGTS